MKFIAFAACLFFLSSQAQEKLWYEKPATKWVEALPIGNGRLGAMIFGGVEKEHIQFNEETLWTGGPRPYSRPGAYVYLDSLRNLLFQGKQKQADQLAEKHFMGLKSAEGEKEKWMAAVLAGKGVSGDPSKEAYNDNSWNQMKLPSFEGWETQGYEGLDGALWFRTRFELPENWNGKDLVLDLNRIRDFDRSFVNGHLVGSTTGADPRLYNIPASFLHPGSNVIAIQVLNFFDKGGMMGYKDSTRNIGLRTREATSGFVSLKGNWKFWIQDSNPPAQPHYQADYQPFGDLWIDFSDPAPATNYKRELDLTQALHRVSYTQGADHISRTAYVSAPQQALVYEITTDGKSGLSFSTYFTAPHQQFEVTQVNQQTLQLKVAVKHGALWGISQLAVKVKSGKISIRNKRIEVEGAATATLILTAATNYKDYKTVDADPLSLATTQLKQALQLDKALLWKKHLAEYSGYYKRFSIDLGKSALADRPTDQRIQSYKDDLDPALASLYVQYGRYLLIASSRPGTRPANLQGIWNDLMLPPWGSKYTTNINAEMNYWPAEILNLSDLHAPLIQMIRELAETGKSTARDFYNSPGWVLHHNTDLWRGTAPINAANHGIWVSGSGWLAHHLWEHYLFTQDRKFLKDTAWQILRDAADFYSHYLVKDPKTGWLISGPSNSPEQGGLVMAPSMDHQIIRSLFHIVMKADSILGKNDPLTKVLKTQVGQIAPDQIGKYGQLQEWLDDRDDTANKHRHISHLWGMYPGAEINWDQTPELMRAARQSLLYRGDEATGWSIGWKTNCWARFREGDHAMELLKLLFTPAGSKAGSYPNLFDAHPPFQIDGNFGGAAGIAEMLVQSHAGYIDLLPALPTVWKKGGAVRGICVRGGMVLDFKWLDGKVVELKVNAKQAGPVEFRMGEKRVKMNLKKGETNFLWSEKPSPVKS